LPSPSRDASTRALQWEALPFALFELLLLCGVNEWFAHGQEGVGKDPFSQTAALQLRTSSGCSCSGGTSVESLTTKFSKNWWYDTTLRQNVNLFMG